MIIDIILLGGQVFYRDKGVKKLYLWMVDSKQRYQSDLIWEICCIYLIS